MNRILFENGEIQGGRVELRRDDVRARHMADVLHVEEGDFVKTGEINAKTGLSKIVSMDGERIVLEPNHDSEALKPWVDLILAPPRPRSLKRLLPQLTALGVGDIVLVGAKKVEKDFWGATLLKEDIYRPLLIEGLMQSGTTALPRILPRRNFRAFIRDELEALYGEDKRRIVAHPYLSKDTESAEATYRGAGRLLLAVGPEGGWTDGEVEMLEAASFKRYSLGGRILRTDTALIALLAKLM